MTSGEPNIWRRLWPFALGLMLIALIAPLPDLLDKILTTATAALVFIVASGSWWQEDREQQAGRPGGPSSSATVRELLSWAFPPVLALALLSLGTLTPISDLWDKVFSWVAFAILLAYVGVPMWEYHRARQADQSSSAAIASSDQT